VDSYTAAAVKDGSIATIRLGDVSTVGPIVMTYRKKFIYESPAIAKVFTSISNQTKASQYLAALGTKMTVNGLNIPTQNLDVQTLYRSGAMKK